MQAVENDGNLLAVLGGEDIVKQGGFAGAQVACSSRVSADAIQVEQVIAHP